MSAVKANTKDTTVYMNRQIKRHNEKRIEEISDKCLLCGKCTAVCPVGVQGDKIRIAQRSVRKYNLSPDYSNIDENMLLEGCNKFVSTINKNVSDTDNKKVMYFAGCMTDLTPGISKSTTSILKKAGIRFEIMDRESRICCGKPMLMAGRKEQAQEMIEKNRAVLQASGADILLLSCPICYRIFKEEYRLEGIEVVHHTEFFDRLISEGKLTVSKSAVKYVYHDPCDLGRGCGIYEQPRKVIDCAGDLVEADRHHKESICCGGSLGSLTLSFDKRKALTENALNNLTIASPDTIVTACPLCRSTFNRYADRPVKDIAEILDEATSRKRKTLKT